MPLLLMSDAFRADDVASGEIALHVPPSALVVLIGPAASGKSTWAARHFEPTQIVSSDHCRALIADDENDQEASRDAFRLFHRIIQDRLKRGLLTVADSTALHASARADLLRDAASYHRPIVAIAFDLGADIQRHWNDLRLRHVPQSVLSDQRQALQQALHVLCDEGFSSITIVHSPDEIDRLVVRVGAFIPENDAGPFDIIGDVHGCHDELIALLADLGYVERHGAFSHPYKRRAIFVGDLADRGPANVAVWQTVLAMCEAGHALAVAGNHDNKLMRWLMGRPVRVSRGLGATIDEIAALPEPQQTLLRERLLAQLRNAPSYLLLDGGRLVVTHAGIQEHMIGRWDRHIASFCLYGDVAGFDRDGTPIRRNWAVERHAGPNSPLIVYGHVVVDSPEFVNGTIDIDTGCCFGGALTAIRYPERTIAQVPAARSYAER